MYSVLLQSDTAQLVENLITDVYGWLLWKWSLQIGFKWNHHHHHLLLLIM